MRTYGERVAAALAFAGNKSQNWLASKLGVSQPAVHQMIHGDARGSKYSFTIAQVTGVRIEWLESEEGPMAAEHGATPTAAAEDPVPFRRQETVGININQMPQNIRVLGGALCTNDGEDDGLFEFNGQELDYVRRPPRLMGVKDAYALYALNDCMAPWREHGQLVYVHPGQPVKVGDYVVVQLKQEHDGGPIKAYIKRLVRRTASIIVLHQYNPAKDITIPAKKVGKIERIIDWSELMGI